MNANPELDDLLARVAAIEDRSAERLRAAAMEQLSPARPGTGDAPAEPTVGFSPFAPATVIASGAIDWAALASGLVAAPTIALGASAAEGVAQKLIRADATIAAFDATAPTASAVGDAAAVGAVAFAARRDHRHGREAFAVPAIALGTAAAAGVATTPIRSDATVVAFDATAPVTQAFGDAAAVGAAAVAARRDHRHGMPANPVSFATPAIALGTAAAAGVAGTVIRSDATIVAFDATAPTTQALGDAAAAGAAAVAARRDHRHGMPALSAAVPLASAVAGAVGSGVPSSREDHVHPAGAASQASRDAAAGAADYVARIRLGADTTYRASLGLDASDRGALEFGPGGTAARDVSLYRSAADILKTDDSLEVVLGAAFGGEAAASNQVRVGAALTSGVIVLNDTAFGLRIFQTGDTQPRVALTNGGSIQLGAGGATAPDVALYRAAANVLRSDDAISSVRGAATDLALQALVGGDTAGRLNISAAGALQWSSGAAAADVVMSRGAVDRLDLATGDSLNIVSGALMVAATNVVGTRKTGWGAPTGTATRTTFATSTVTTAQLAERVKALIDDLTTHGLIGA